MQKRTFMFFFITLILQACQFFTSTATPTVNFLLPTPQVVLTIEMPKETTPFDQTQPTTLPNQLTQTQSPQITDLPTSDIDSRGLKVVYIKMGDLWLWEERQTYQLTNTGTNYNPIFSDDGQVIAFLRQVDSIHNELWAINANGADERRLVSIEDLDQIGGGVRDPNAIAIVPYRYNWMPGSHTLAFNTQQVFQGSGLSLLDDLNLVDADTGELKFLLLSGWGGEFFFSPDGKKVAITMPDNILLMDVNAENYQSVLTYDPVLTYSEYRYYAQPVWSPDSNFIRVAIPPVESLASPDQVTEIWRISADGAQVELEEAFSAVPFFEDIYGRAVVFSPNLQYLAYLKEVDQPSENRHQLRILAGNTDGAWTFLEERIISFETWSTDSKNFVFLTGEDQKAWFGDIDGIVSPFSENPYGVLQVRWIDDRHILYLQQTTDSFELLLGKWLGTHIEIDQIHGAPPSYDFHLGSQ